MALVALLVRGLIPAGWMPASSGDAPFTICSLAKTVSDTATGGKSPSQDDPRAHEECPFAAAPLAPVPDNVIFLTPVLQYFIAPDEDVVPVRQDQRGYTPQAPRAPPQAI